MVEELVPPPVEPRPGVGNSYTHAWRQLWRNSWRNFFDLLLAGIVYIVVLFAISFIIGIIFSAGWRDSITSLSSLLFGTSMTNFAWHLLISSSILQIFLFTPLFWGLLFLFLCAASARTVELNHLFDGFRHSYLRVAETSLLWWLVFSAPSLLIMWLGELNGAVGTFLTVAWFFVSIVLYSRLIYVPFLLMDQGMTGGKAFSTSWEWSRGHALENFLIFLLGALIMMGGLIVFLVGVIPAALWFGTAVASQYHAVSLEKGNPVVYPSPLVP